MDTQKLHDLIDKVIGKDGPLRTPAYWMRRVLRAVADLIDEIISNIDVLPVLDADVKKTKLKLDSTAYLVSKIYDNWYLTFIALEDGLSVRYSKGGDYRIDDGDWKTITGNEYTPPINKGQRVSFRSYYIPKDGIDTSSGRFFTKGAYCKVSGSPMSLLYGDEIGRSDVPRYAFAELFQDNKHIKEVSENFLPATILAERCYEKMFYGCTNLVDAPILPATTLAEGCYEYMFYGCTSLVDAPILPATTLAEGCYEHMFYGCTNLVNAPILPATTLAEGCYELMFRGCTSLVNAPELHATTLAVRCYRQMFYGCTSLVNAPELHATTLAKGCCEEMFRGCTSLVNAPELHATTLAGGCYEYMFYGCTSLVNAIIHATAFAEECCNYMFKNCNNLNYIKAMFVSRNITNASTTLGWLDGVSPNGTFVKNEAATWWPTGTHGIPEGWTVENATE